MFMHLCGLQDVSRLEGLDPSGDKLINRTEFLDWWRSHVSSDSVTLARPSLARRESGAAPATRVLAVSPVAPTTQESDGHKMEHVVRTLLTPCHMLHSPMAPQSHGSAAVPCALPAPTGFA